LQQTVNDLKAHTSRYRTVRVVVSISGMLIVFLFGLELMIVSFHHLDNGPARQMLAATSNPFTALFIGLLITAIIQSSSTTTALAVALVASQTISLENAVPLIMGANIGTTITACIVSLAFINQKKEFRRAVAAASYHCFFNLVTAFILFPLEYNYQLLSRLSLAIGGYFTNPGSETASYVSPSTMFDLVTDPVARAIGSPVLSIALSFLLLFFSILLFRKYISRQLQTDSPEWFGRFFFERPLKSFLWGLVTTAAIRSSTITSSVVVTIVAKKIAPLKQAAAFILGANVGTTVTALIAAALGHSTGAISIALAHFLFNLTGVLVFFPLPVLFKGSVELSRLMGRLTSRYRLVGLIFVVLTFFIIPFILIQLSQ
jgi:solute carrier family 34 (sodium-dependent phosphate cotransporter)